MSNKTNFDPIPRLQHIAATIKENGGIADIFDSPATSAYYIECAIKEIERLRKERDEARREVCKAESSGRIGRFGTAQEHAKRMGWDCFKEENTDG